MKFRLDFVTNSSSSSFIGVFAKLDKNHKNFDSNTKLYDQYIRTGKEILEDMTRQYFYDYGADWAGVYLTPNKKDIKEDELYILWEQYGGAGDDDSDFSIYDSDGDWVDYDYDVDLSDFHYEVSTYEYLTDESNGFVDVLCGYGAGRNG